MEDRHHRSPDAPAAWKCTECKTVFSQEDIALLHTQIVHSCTLPSLPDGWHPIMHVQYPGLYIAYKHTTTLVARKMIALEKRPESDTFSHYQTLEHLMFSGDNDAGPADQSEALGHLLCAARCRRALLQIATILCEDVNAEFTPAVTHDENEIMRHFALASKADIRYIVALQGRAAADMLELVDLILHHTTFTDHDIAPFSASMSTFGPDLRRSLQRIFVRLFESSLQSPARLLLSEVSLEDRQPVDRGSYGEIYKGIYHGRSVALKAARTFQNRGDNADVLKAFHREVAIVRSISHPYICPMLGIDDVSFKGTTCIVLPWMDFGNVLQYITKPARRSDAEIVRLLRQLVLGILHLHKNGIVHGDLHIGNILVDAMRNVQLSDFGRANLLDAETSCSSGQPGATRCMAPEILDPFRFRLPRVQHTPASDMYSFGQVSWQMFTGKLPFPHMTNMQAMFAILDGKTQERTQADRVIPDILWNVMQGCWRYQPAKRIDAEMAHKQLISADAINEPRVPLRPPALARTSAALVPSSSGFGQGVGRCSRFPQAGFAALSRSRISADQNGCRIAKSRDLPTGTSLDLAARVSRRDPVIHYLQQMLRKEPEYSAFLRYRTESPAIAHQVPHWAYLKAKLEEHTANSVPAEEPGAGTLISMEHVASAFGIKPSRVDMYIEALMLTELYGPGGRRTEDAAVAVMYHEPCMVASTWHLRRYLDVLRDIHARWEVPNRHSQ